MAKNYPERRNKLPRNKLAMQESTSITPTHDGNKKKQKKSEDTNNTTPMESEGPVDDLCMKKKMKKRMKKGETQKGNSLRNQPNKPGQLRTKVYTSRVV
jgi:hypothetical protein